MMAPHPKRILIVEDNKLDVRLLRDILETRGHETLQTGDGLEAINLAVANLPDLILMDIQLPVVSGLEVTRRLRDDDRCKRIPIIAVTAFAMGWHEREALDSGCDAYISKPITILGFLRTVESLLSRFSC
jgi:two-component system, cell cycle response regulator DivK